MNCDVFVIGWVAACLRGPDGSDQEAGGGASGQDEQPRQQPALQRGGRRRPGVTAPAARAPGRGGGATLAFFWGATAFPLYFEIRFFSGAKR